LIDEVVQQLRPTLSPLGFELLLRKVTERILGVLETILFFPPNSSEFGEAGMGMVYDHSSLVDGAADGGFGDNDTISQFGALKLANDLRVFMVRVSATD